MSHRTHLELFPELQNATGELDESLMVNASSGKCPGFLEGLVIGADPSRGLRTEGDAFEHIWNKSKIQTPHTCIALSGS